MSNSRLAFSILILCSFAHAGKNYSGPYFTLDLFDEMIVDIDQAREIKASMPAGATKQGIPIDGWVSVRYLPDVLNQASATVQCATMDKILLEEFRRLRELAERDNSRAPDEFSKTTVTFDRWTPGRSGGSSILVSQVKNLGPFRGQNALDIYVAALPRAKGTFVIQIAMTREFAGAFTDEIMRGFRIKPEFDRRFNDIMCSR